MQLTCGAVERSLAELLQETALFLWKEWPKDMRLSSMGQGTFVITGECPHCRKQAAFETVGGVHEEHHPETGWATRAIAAARCIACGEYILAGLKADPALSGTKWSYGIHYPLGKPNDTLADEIPDAIRPDFREALRCRWVDAYNATVEMCRRALESSCLQLGADPKLGTLEKMIDWVHGQGKITTPLKDMAHKIRLGGDRGAHPSTRTMGPEDADAVIEFTRQYFDHVYVMPARVDKFDFSRPKPPNKGAP